jgi:hypothetical protein
MKKSLLLPVLIGAAAAGAIAWFLISEDTADLRSELSEKLRASFDKVKDKAMNRLTGDQFGEDSVQPNSHV